MRYGLKERIFWEYHQKLAVGMPPEPARKMRALRSVSELHLHYFGRPYGTWILLHSNPALKRRAIVIGSLRDCSWNFANAFERQ
jgi:hypothetical protein